MDGLQINLESSSFEMPINLEDVASPMEGVTSGHKVKRKRKLTSKVWSYFDVLPLDVDELGANTQKSQLELYLEEPRMATEIELNVLDYWKANQFRYPEVASMARDLLSIPISTVASESAFSIGGRVLDQFRSSLKPSTVEEIVCTRDWLFGQRGNYFY
ncbi:zinc finger BED domain-containing protein DAYSLEEPER-like [Ziziphus jujuba]|uniref:Zinc finger BED domain-containing protein DAYSLEEPER-like n=1 Tax=Ziziphus jujuba TaxID=326968 RepID=A0ABM4AEI4_ZIZJJ|nr:zinc finger BED domain-containing protein DAYSLEEPER-like [Ziziphus jujuba]